MPLRTLQPLTCEGMANAPIGPVLEYYGWNGRGTGYGSWKTIHCPFHGDRKSSGRVNEDEGVFHCHACAISGNAVKCIEQHEGVTYDEAKRRVHEITGSWGGPSKDSGSGWLKQPSKLPAWTRGRVRALEQKRLLDRS